MTPEASGRKQGMRASDIHVDPSFAVFVTTGLIPVVHAMGRLASDLQEMRRAFTMPIAC
ncbi:MAG: hypothetical protein KIS86_13725 [Devosia sp.]|nr:hypothetical protein [Devosia sp.]